VATKDILPAQGEWFDETLAQASERREDLDGCAGISRLHPLAMQ
jgi:hypothetical protein